MKTFWTCTTSTQTLNVRYKDCSFLFVMLADICFPSQGTAKKISVSHLVGYAPLRSLESILSTPQSAEIASTSNERSHNDMLSSKSGNFFSQPLCLANVLRYPTMGHGIQSWKQHGYCCPSAIYKAVTVPHGWIKQYKAAILTGKFFDSHSDL